MIIFRLSRLYYSSSFVSYTNPDFLYSTLNSASKAYVSRICCSVPEFSFEKNVTDYQNAVSKQSRITFPLPFTLCRITNIDYRFSHPFYVQRRNRSFKRLSWPIDHLPFKWTRREQKADVFDSGDLDHTIGSVDFSAPKLSFLHSEELQTASDDVKKLFTLKTASQREIVQYKEHELIKRIQQHSVDFNSPQVRIAVLTLKVRNLQQRFSAFPQDKVVKSRLLLAVQKRNKLLRLMHHADYKRFKWLIQELGIVYEAPPMGVKCIQYTRKNELRRLTKEYCDKVRNEKLEKFHAKLKEQQKEFIKEKEETLKWIEEEEKVLEELRTKLETTSISTSTVGTNM